MKSEPPHKLTVHQVHTTQRALDTSLLTFQLKG